MLGCGFGVLGDMGLTVLGCGVGVVRDMGLTVLGCGVGVVRDMGFDCAELWFWCCEGHGI